jgi:RNA polymerase sigma factor (sigma-70 family)
VDLAKLVERTRRGDRDAAGQLVEATHRGVYAAIRAILRDRDEALDALQDTYLRALRRLGTLEDPAVFGGWLRRIAVTTAVDRVRRRRNWLGEEALLKVPILDDQEEEWNEAQRVALARALYGLNEDDRRLCERFYHARWSTAQLAASEGTTPSAMRKRLQRLRERLRGEVEMSERNQVRDEVLPLELPSKLAELLATPRLTELPENPVGSAWERIRADFGGAQEVILPEILSIAEIRRSFPENEGALLSWIDEFCFRIDDERVLRTELSIPLLMEARRHPGKRRLIACGKCYRRVRLTPHHREAFHLGELLSIETERDPWSFLGEIVEFIREIFPSYRYQVEPAGFPLWEPSWAVSLVREGRPFELLECGQYRPEVVHLLKEPEARVFGASFGLERFAMVLFSLDDIRKTDFSPSS